MKVFFYKYDENNGWNQLGQSINGTTENEKLGESISLNLIPTLSFRTEFSY